MNTKTFAQKSRKILMSGVAKKLLYWGFNTDGAVLETPKKIQGGYSFRGQVYDDPSVIKLWETLKKAIQKKGVNVVIEEAAYTWFNRIMALRIMAKNGYENEQLAYIEGAQTPIILQKARAGQYAFLDTPTQTRLQRIISEYSKENDAFAILLIAYYHSNQTLNKVFGKIDDYTELLLPNDMLQQTGFLHLLNTTDAISDEDYKKVELIGWLYQFYISEKKDEVFASFKKKKKAEAKDIPAATQIFTPNWIVKYMVENTVGKIWLDKNPNSPIKATMKYLVENESDTQAKPIIDEIAQLTLIDPAAGSGHILVEGFDLLYQMYIEEYYEPEEAVESILKNNLFGLDIDVRAAQLATFAILLKAAKQYRDVFSKGWMPNMYAMPEPNAFETQEIYDFLGTDGKEFVDELSTALTLMQQAQNLGSVMQLSLSQEARAFIKIRFTALKKEQYGDINTQLVYDKIKAYIPILLLLTQKYTAVVANPPYMGQKNMNADLKNYITKNYPISKSDLFAVFMDVGMALSVDNGAMGIINQHSWMFLSSYEKLRTYFLSNYSIDSMLHLGSRTFEELSGEVVQSTAFVFKKKKLENSKLGATYVRLVDYKNIHLKEEKFLSKKNIYRNVLQVNFFKIPGSPIAYWVSEGITNLFSKDKVAKFGISDGQNITGNNAKYLKNIWEISKNKTGKGSKWVPIAKGGSFRKWFGNIQDVVDWSDVARKFYKESKIGRIQNKRLWFRTGITWNLISSGGTGFRILEDTVLFNKAAPTILFNIDNSTKLHFVLALLNTNIVKYLLNVLNPTFNTNIAEILNIPIVEKKKDKVDYLVNETIILSKSDWDSRETSWDFKQIPLLNERINIEQSYNKWQKEVTKDFFQLHANEEELNRIFIDIYGLQEELTPEVALKDITILQKELNKKDLEALEPIFRAEGKEAVTLPINKKEVISQFISYAIGLFMGRYRLDKPGLNIAHPNPTATELASYTYNNGTVTIDSDAIIPLMGEKCNFQDDALQQINQLLDTLWGSELRTENINFIQEALDADLEKFLVKDFYKYHTKMYNKKPIYWQFASVKGAFQVLVYMHRLNEFTVEKIRANYLMPHLKNLRSKEAHLAINESILSTQEGKRLEQLRKDIFECEEYDLEIKNIAEQQIKIDLDDGVTVNYKKFETVVAKIK